MGFGEEKDVFSSKSEGRGSLDFDLGGGARISSTSGAITGSRGTSRRVRSKKAKQGRTPSDLSVAEGDERADEKAKDVCNDGGKMAQIRGEHHSAEMKKVYAAFQYAASFHWLVEEWRDCEEVEPKPKDKWIFVDNNEKAKTHRTEWCAAASRYR